MAGTPSKEEIRLLAYMVGWRKGAGVSALSERDQSDADFMAGWHAGRQAKKEAYAVASAQYGTALSVVRIQSVSPEKGG